MLILTRKTGESIIIGGHTTVKVLEVRGRTVRLGIQAPKDVTVDREEVAEAKEADRVEHTITKQTQNGGNDEI